jgi:hypothetical protein
MSYVIDVTATSVSVLPCGVHMVPCGTHLLAEGGPKVPNQLETCHTVIGPCQCADVTSA